ncbi:Agrin [Araneus ventricosus]|uniref:Agrin n=1 Tax=Araneus ventricosus TaxID=182803 RepID=A0A4Y2X607_ARAVE|nr:Agrin [Araneus ventricosus]GBO44973.1 Agrin [Araneus ventricosus]
MVYRAASQWLFSVCRSEGQRETNIEVTFRTSHHKGLLLWTNKGATIRGDYLALAISKGYAQLSFNLGKQKEPLLITSLHRVDDSRWHTALIERNMRFGTLTMDDNPPISNTSEPGATELNTDGVYWIGKGKKPAGTTSRTPIDPFCHVIILQNVQSPICFSLDSTRDLSI